MLKTLANQLATMGFLAEIEKVEGGVVVRLQQRDGNYDDRSIRSLGEFRGTLEELMALVFFLSRNYDRRSYWDE